MTWQSSGIIPSNLNWTNISGMSRANSSATATASLWYNSTLMNFNPNRNYKFVTTVENFRRNNTFTNNKFLQIHSPWGSSFSYATASVALNDTRPNNASSNDLVWFSRPSSAINSNDHVEYRSTYNGFGNPSSDSDGQPVIKNFKLVEIDWRIQGWSLTDTDNLHRGWRYNDSNNSLVWRNVSNVSTVRRAIGLSDTSQIIGITGSNYIARYIDYPKFNMKFKLTQGANNWIDIYLVSNFQPNTLNTTNVGSFLTTLNNTDNAQFIGRINGTYTNEEFNFYDLTGEKWLLITSRYLESNNTVTLSDFIFDGSYQENDNNNQFLFTNTDQFYEPTNLNIIGGSPDATYSTIVVNENTLHNPASASFFGPTGSPGFFSTLYGNVINLNQLNSKVGNGTFRAGIWENGVWNNGWRVDTQVYEFNDILFSIQTNTINNKWRIQINGTTNAVAAFEIGDKVAIGNIVGIDINDNRRLIKDAFTIIAKDLNNIAVEFSNTFPLRRIEKDSENHKIKVTKNIWLNGAFFNGYFEGVWNNGLFKGSPYITEMYNTHWVDGFFDGGHYYSEYPEWTFVDTVYWFDTTPNTLGLTFGATAHGLVVGDKVIIDKTDKTINPQYDGEAEVVAVIDDYLVILNKAFGASSTNEGGIIKRKWGTGVIQHFNFKDNNVAKRTTKQTSNLQEVYKYNSWIDVKYLTQSASNLNREQITSNPNFTPPIAYSELNLYGFITNDVLSSDSTFRNSWSLGNSKYSLGTKWRIFNDYLGSISEFNEPFNSANSTGMDNFYNNGWTLSTTTAYTISRTPDETLEIIRTTPWVNKLDNTNINIEKKRYSLIEFDLINFQSSTDTFAGSLPFIYFYNNTNIPGNTSNAPAFPISEYVYHTRTEDLKKREYFYNRRSLDLFLLNQTGFTASFDNIKFYEVDMIPFFQYTNEEYINKAIQVPFQGIAPFIDYENLNFSFIDNISIQLDSLSTQQTFTQPSIANGSSTTNVNIIIEII